MRIHRAEVRAIRRLTPGMIRITFGGLEGFDGTGVGDEYLRVFLPPSEDRRHVPLPLATTDSWEWPDGAEQSPLRTYTVRNDRSDVGEVDIDFVVHDGGIAARWALAARPGDVVGLNSPTGMYAPPDDLAWQLLVTDQAGLPAAARLIEDAPAGVTTRLVAEVPDAEHQLAFDVPPGVEVRWVAGGNGHGPSSLAEVVRTALPTLGYDASARDLPGGYIWVAGETKVLRDVRRHLRHELSLPAIRYKVVGYWTEDAEAWRDRYEALDQTIKDELMAMWDTDRDEEDIQDDYVARLETLGL